MSKVLAIIVTYFPDKDSLYCNFTSFANDVDKILIWENTPETEKLKYRYIKHHKVEYCGDGLNSISHALNYGWKYARNNGYDYLLTMDQDSEWFGFSEFLNTVISGEFNNAICGPSIGENVMDLYKEVPMLITSGTLVPISILNSIGGYWEYFAIDCVDWEFCCRAHQNGYKTYMVGSGVLKQQFGVPHITRLFGKDFAFSSYSAGRRFNTAKNKMIILRKFNFSFYYKLKILYSELIYKSFLVLMFDDSKFLKIEAIWKGVFEGMFLRHTFME